MAYTVEEFNPVDSTLVINKRPFAVLKVTLRVDLLVKKEFGGINKAFESIEKDPLNLLNLFWILVKDKAFFKHDVEAFKKYVFGASEPLKDLSMKMSLVLQETIRDSMPLIVNAKRYKEIQEVLSTTTDSKPCYVRYYDTIAKRYGYSIEQFYDLTLRHVHMLLQIIGDASYEELEVQAALNGKALQPRIQYDHNISEEEVQEQEDDAMAALLELQRKYKENKDK